MKKFEYNISIPAQNQSDADRIMKSVVKTIARLTPEEWERIADVVSNPVQLAMIKSKLGL